MGIGEPAHLHHRHACAYVYVDFMLQEDAQEIHCTKLYI